jgi:hypothetical protein
MGKESLSLVTDHTYSGLWWVFVVEMGACYIVSTVYPRLTWNSGSFCLSLLSTGITGVYWLGIWDLFIYVLAL